MSTDTTDVLTQSTRRQPPPEAAVPPTITVTDAGLAMAVLGAPVLRPRLKVIVRIDGRDHPAMGRAIELGRVGETKAWLVVAVLADLAGTVGAIERVAIGRSASRGEPSEAIDLPALLRSTLARQPEGVRQQIVSAAAAVAASVPPTLELSRDLHTLREALREHLTQLVVTKDRPPGMTVEVLARIDERAVYLRGWIGHLSVDLSGVALVSPEGEHIEIGSRLYRFSRPDVGEFYGRAPGSEDLYGFACTVELNTPNAADHGWLLTIETTSGLLGETSAAVTATDALAIREIIVADLVLERLPDSAFRSAHVAPAITRLQQRLLRSSGVASVDELGRPPADPRVTVIVPLYKRIDFVQHQLAQFVHDPAMADVDLVYVLDSPEIGEAFRAECRRLHRLYRIPFRAVVLKGNLGFSGANNAGAQLARGRYLLLLNSDVLPDQPGWLTALADFLERTPGAGAVAPKLLYEDGSLQHAGLYFDRQEGAALWSNEHYFKGLHGSLPAANVTRTVPAVTAACLLMETDVYRAIGGLQGTYVQGDFEDSDLCLRLRREGHDVWYLAEVQLYHLEGQSYPTPMRVSNGEYNQWLHTHLWGDAITQAMEDN